jgi:hypothetical protein
MVSIASLESLVIKSNGFVWVEIFQKSRGHYHNEKKPWLSRVMRVEQVDLDKEGIFGWYYAEEVDRTEGK